MEKEIYILKDAVSQKIIYATDNKELLDDCVSTLIDGIYETQKILLMSQHQIPGSLSWLSSFDDKHKNCYSSYYAFSTTGNSTSFPIDFFETKIISNQ